MLYRISLDLAFETQDACADILDKALDHLREAKTINPGAAFQEQGFIKFVECHHDDDPSAPCDEVEAYYTPIP